ncbi:MAG: hypothetical protein SVY10_18170 [Thermodesulfobacteriota bacterium]|nr:hypothetical protein [Thermodesulfobacteriota bacterium]
MNAKQMSLSPEQREKILQNLMVLWDGRWFLKTVEKFGFNAATELNLAITKSFGKTEMKLLLAETHFGEIKNIEDFKAIMDIFADLCFPDMQKYEFQIVDENTFLGRFYECHVHIMTSKAGTQDIHQCAGKPRAEGWLEGLGLDGEVIKEKNTHNCNGSCETFVKIKW